MPFFAPSVTTETDAAFSFLTHQCAQLRVTTLGLSDEQARRVPTASPLSIAGLLAHVAQVVNGWLMQVKEPDRVIEFSDFPAINAELGLDGMFDGTAVPDRPLEDVVTIFDKAVAEIDVAHRIVEDRGIGLRTEVSVPRTPWMPTDFVMTVGWILWHLATEVARHAGHADIIRESIDGATAYQLNAEADGEPWPPDHTEAAECD